MPLLTSLILLGVGLVAILLDLGVFARRLRPLNLPEAIGWSTLWIVLALAFTGVVYLIFDLRLTRLGGEAVDGLSGQEASLQFFASWLIAKAVALGNVLVIAIVFSYFPVPLSEQRRVLFWGILAMVPLRALTLPLGGWLFDQFDGMAYLLGGVLAASAGRVLVARRETIDPEKNLGIFLIDRWAPPCGEFAGGRFIVRRDGRRSATPLAHALILILTADVMFAIDAVPATFAVTRNPFLVLAANVFALFGLRAALFVVFAFLDRIRYLQLSLVILFVLVGAKMILSPHFDFGNLFVLATAGAILVTGVLASGIAGGRHPPEAVTPFLQDIEELVWISYRQARRLVVLLIGSTVMLIGVIMTVTPGPAFIIIPLGLAILAIEFAWARRWLARIGSTIGQVEKRLSKRFASRSGKEEDDPAGPSGDTPSPAEPATRDGEEGKNDA